LPFYTVGALALVLWIMLWVWLPRSPGRPSRPLAFLSHYRNVGSSAMFWYVLAANSLFQMAFIGVFGYLAAHLIQTYGLGAGETVLPLALAGTGVIARGFIGGRVADHRRRLALFAMCSLAGGLLAALVFIAPVSPWATVALAFAAGSLASVTQAVTPTLLIELAGGSRATATGLYAVSNQLGIFGGASLGGLMLALGGFPMVGLFCLGVAIIGVAVLRLKVRDSAEFRQQTASAKSQAEATS
ncbi:MAG TPA: MFS transporter, partial [Dehalococcoidia bacterium]|nr:MFS transporter [Dehalococcoidia bacterium]